MRRKSWTFRKWNSQLAAAGCLLLYLSRQAATEEVHRMDNVSVVLSMERTEFQTGASIPVRTTVKNLSEKAVRVSSFEGPSPLTYTLTPASADQRPLLLERRNKVRNPGGEPQIQHPIEFGLGVGGSLSQQEDLTKLADGPLPTGDYVLTVAYRWIDHAAGTPTFRDTASAPLPLRITPAKSTHRR